MGLLDLPTEATRAVEPRVPQRAVTGDLGEPMRNRLMASAGGLAGDRRRLVTILVERRVADECGVFRVRLLEFVPEKNVGVVDLAVGDLEAAPRIAGNASHGLEARKNWCEVIRGEVCVMGGVAGLIAYLVYGNGDERFVEVRQLEKKKARAMSSAPALTARPGRVLDG